MPADTVLRPFVIAPQHPKPGAPEHTPDAVAKFFRQGRSSLQAGHYDAAGSMYRKTLETALKNAFPNLSGDLTLYKRIEAAKEQGGLTEALADWAQRIRGLGNNAAHEEEPFDENDAKMLDQFTELMLTYVFTLPGKLAEARGAPDDML
ncbi:MAG: DUF4145 domain-containing protein [Rhodospirillales bacterium]|nr:DUF4145 domain-containing protein [Rhodospirillales bacterium]